MKTGKFTKKIKNKIYTTHCWLINIAYLEVSTNNYNLKLKKYKKLKKACGKGVRILNSSWVQTKENWYIIRNMRRGNKEH